MQANGSFGLYGVHVGSLDMTTNALTELALTHLREITTVEGSVHVIIVTGRNGGSADVDPIISQDKAKSQGLGMTRTLKSSCAALTTAAGTPFAARGTRSLRSTRTNLDVIQKPLKHVRATRIICTLGPACWSEAGMRGLLDAGCDVVRLNFSHGTHEGAQPQAYESSKVQRDGVLCMLCSYPKLAPAHAGPNGAWSWRCVTMRHADEQSCADHAEALRRFRLVCAAKAAEMGAAPGLASAPTWATLLDTKGPAIRSAMLRGGQNIMLEKGQPIIIEAVGDDYTEFEGYKDEEETRIGLSYAKLCNSVSTGDRILIADGSIAIGVDEIISPIELRGTVLNSKELGQRKNCNLPGVKVDLPVLTEKDMHDLREFACRHSIDYVAASFVQSADDVRLIRSVLDSAGGERVKIISKIENEEGLANFKEILRETDGVMVARGDLGARRALAPALLLGQGMLQRLCWWATVTGGA
jgi:Pyruvate kinase, barrel domain